MMMFQRCTLVIVIVVVSTAWYLRYQYMNDLDEVSGMSDLRRSVDLLNQNHIITSNN